MRFLFREDNCGSRNRFPTAKEISEHFIVLRFPYNEEVVKILDEQTVGGVVDGVNKVLLFTTVYMYVVLVYLEGGRHSPTRLVAHRLLDSCSPIGPQAGAGQCGATPSKLL